MKETNHHSTIDIALCSDRNMLPGLHVTLYSTLYSLDESVTPAFHLFHEGLTQEDVAGLHRTLAGAGKPFGLNVRTVRLDLFQRFKALRGNYMSYARLTLPDLLPNVDRVLYLDSDLIVLADMNDLFVEGLGEASAGFPYDGGTKGLSLDQDVFRAMGFDSGSPYYNAGVILLDLERWREKGFMDKSMEILEQYGDRLASHDQSVLNLLYHDCPVKHFDMRYNVQMYPSRYRGEWENGVHHFIGSPKPWDFMGEFVSCHGERFVRWLDQTDYRGWRSYKQMTPSSLRRALRSGKTYVRCVRDLLTGETGSVS